MTAERPSVPAHGVSFGEALRVWARVALLSFGGPAGQIAVMHRILVDEKRWIGERRFLHALNFCMLLPGPEAMQLATYVGWLLHGWRGGLLAGLLFVIPGALVVLGLAAVYAAFGEAALVEAIFFGVKAAVLAIVLEALTRIARRALKAGLDWVIAGAAFNDPLKSQRVRPGALKQRYKQVTREAKVPPPGNAARWALADRR